MIKKILVFTGLKVAEISAIVFIPYWVGILVSKNFPGYWEQAEYGIHSYWIGGFMSIIFSLLVTILGIATVFFAIMLLYELIKLNIRWTERILRRFK